MINFGSENIHTCDICHKVIAKWQVHGLVDRCYSPGKNFDKCSGNIDMHTKKIAELCPECMNEIVNIFIKEDKKDD